MKTIESYWNNEKARFSLKWSQYLAIYEHHLGRFRGTDVRILEIGVYAGGSLQIWKEYFGPRAQIFGVDIDPRCKAFEDDQVTIFTGSQADRTFLRDVRAKVPPLDIIIDDGGHRMKQQTIAFGELFELVKPSGFYICEDLHTSYAIRFGGGHLRRGTFVELAKRLIDSQHAWFSEQASLVPTSLTRSLYALHFYTCILVIEKRAMTIPTEITRGSVSTRPVSKRQQVPVIARIGFRFFMAKEYILRALRMPSSW